MYNFATKMPQEEYHEYLFDVLQAQMGEIELYVLTWISRNFSASTGGPWSIGAPEPLNTLPSISTLMGMRRTSPVNSQVVFRLSIPAAPSKIWMKKNKRIVKRWKKFMLTYTTACFPLISRTWPFLTVPFPSRTFTISAYFGNLTLSRTTKGPTTSWIVL